MRDLRLRVRAVQRGTKLCGQRRQFRDAQAAAGRVVLPAREALAVEKLHRNGGQPAAVDKVMDTARCAGAQVRGSGASRA